ncbi:MAG: ABC transporter ATP-binding protein [Thermoguttaceae bacterium]
MTAVIQFNDVIKVYGSEVALASVSFEVPPGTVFALLGENGAGKTTAIRIMLGLAQPDRGRSTVLGMESGVHGEHVRRRVGYVAERPTLYDWMTVREIGWFASGFYPEGFLTRYVAEVEKFGLPLARRIKAMSKGQRAKVSLALALAHDPELMILDEPTSGLDALVRREFLESMVDRAAAGKTVFLSSHQIAEVERVADVVAILRKGKLLAIDRLDELKARIREVTLTLADDGETPLPAPLSQLDGRLLSRRRRGRQWQALVENLPGGLEAALHQTPGVQAVEVRTPSLEEIFVAYMERPLQGLTATGAAEVSP